MCKMASSGTPISDIESKKRALDAHIQNLRHSLLNISHEAKQSNDSEQLEKTINKILKIQEQVSSVGISQRNCSGKLTIPEISEGQFHALVSSNQDDREVASAVVEALEENNFKVFNTQWDILPNEAEAKSLQKAMKNSRKKILLITQSFRQKAFMTYQVAEFIQDMIDRDKANFIPVFIGVEESDIPACITGSHGIFISDENWKDRLVHSLCIDSPLDSLIPAGDVATGLAWSYYYGFLSLTLPEFHLRAADFENHLRDPIFEEKLKQKGIIGQKPFLKKFVCILSSTSYCPDILKDEDPNIITIGNEEFEKSVAGNEKRSYRTSVHYVRNPDNEAKDKGYFFMGEFCTPLRSMYRMEAGKIAGLSAAERQEQTNIFHKKIKEIMHHPCAATCLQNFVHVPYRDANTKDGEKQKLSKLLCDTIRTEFEMDQSRQNKKECAMEH